MSLDFKQLMAQATRLTRAGDLHAAKAVIQAALGAAAANAPRDAAAQPGDTCVIEVEAREVEPDTSDARTDARTDARVDGRTDARVEVRTHPRVDPGAAETAAAPVAQRTGRFIAGSHSDATGVRAYKLYVPPGHRGQALPLVVMLHGCTQDPDDFAAGTGMNEAARARGFYVLYPAQAQNANPSRCWNWFKHNHQQRDRGEPALLVGMTREVVKRHDIDPRRVYVAGLSAGGAMAAILGEAYPDVFAAVGVHSGLSAGSARDATSAFAAMKNGAATAPAAHGVPTIVFHGDEDNTVHPLNGEQVVAARVGAARAELERARSANGRAYTRRVYRDQGGRVVAEHWTVHGTGHAWSGGRAHGTYTDAKGPDASEEMLRFFFAHVLETAAPA